MITISGIERGTVKKEGSLYFTNILAQGESKDFFLFSKEISNVEFSEDFIGNSFCFFHDFGEHSGRYIEVFSRFISSFKKPTRILLLDLNGHGKSGGTRGHIESLEEICLNFISTLNYWNGNANSGLGLISFGLGGVIALKIIHLFFSHLNPDITGLVLLNPGLKWRWSMPGFLENLGSNGIDSLKKIKLPFELNGELFAEDSIAAQSFDADPLINHTMTWGTFLEIQKGASMTRTSGYYLDVPVFIGLSGKDRLYDYNVTELFARGISDCKVQHYEEAFHDILHYFENEKVTKDVYNWMKDKSLINEKK